MLMLLTQIRALAAATVSRQLRWRSLGLRLVRISVPLAILPIIRLTGRLQDLLKDKDFLRKFGLSKKDAKDMAENLSRIGLEKYIDAGLDAFLCAALVGIAMLMLIMFAQHLTAESESGLRRLLHIVGLSRYAYWTTVVSLEGSLQMFLDLLVLLFGARFALGLRMAQETSLGLLLIALFLLVSSTVTVGCLFHMLFRKARSSTLVAMLVAMVIFASSLWRSGAAIAFSQDLLEVSKGAWGWLFLCPVLPSFHILALCGKACHQGKCILLQELPAFQRSRKQTPLTAALAIVSRSQQGGGGHTKTPDAEELVNLVELVVLEIVLLSAASLLYDAWLLPAIRRAWSRGDAQGPPGLKAAELVHSYSWTGGRTLDGVSFSISPGETLGLLGPNGAGKTTTIRCITGEESQQRGSIVYRPSSVAYTGETFIGLCPQDTILVEDLLVEEHLRLFARIKALPESKLSAAVEQMLKATKLEEKRHAFPSQLSGGMRRRLGIGCALIGSSAMSLLDEPTTGLDPVSRRGIWELIGAAKDDGTCILLTTHMLEEAEELCSDIVILVKGKVAIKGSVQELKATWGCGYTLNVDTQAGRTENVREFIASLLPENLQSPSKMAQNKLVFKVGQDAEFVGRLFIKLAGEAASNGIRNWGISQASLEEAYVRIIQSES